MIQISIAGGLGNQLFQYSFSRYLSSMYSGEVRFDLSFYLDPRRLPHERFFLRDLLEIDHRSHCVLGMMSGFGFLRKILRLTLTTEREFEAGNIAPGSIVRGNWQNLRYAYFGKQDIEKRIFRNRGQAQQKIAEGSVALHLRGNDLRRGGYGGKHVLLKEKYYRDAIDFFGHDKNYTVYTDDIVFAKELLPTGISVSFRGTESVKETVNDFVSLCSHNNIVCANSTFSWWAAYLGANKKVVFPKDDRYIHQSLIPDGWNLI